MFIPTPKPPMHLSTASLRRQRGNTLTGIIIGLIVGLVIAVVVALAITKGSTPFTDKFGKLGKMSEPTPGQASDPNKPLYANKEAARAANKELSDKQNDQPNDKPNPEAQKAEADPLGAAIAGMQAAAQAPAHASAHLPAPAPSPAPAAKAGAPAAPEEDKVVYYLQAGAFREVADAENTRAKLALLGFEAVISDRASDSGVLHRVRIGPYAQAEAMNKARAKLQSGGVDVAIVRNQK